MYSLHVCESACLKMSNLSPYELQISSVVQSNPKSSPDRSSIKLVMNKGNGQKGIAAEATKSDPSLRCCNTLRKLMKAEIVGA